MKTQDCDRIQAHLIDFIDKTLDAEKTGRVKKHVETCSECQQSLEKTLTIINDLKAVKDIEPPASIKAKFLQELDKEKQLAQKTNRSFTHDVTPVKWLYNPFSQLAAGIAILVSGILLGFLLNRQPETNLQVEQLHKEMNMMKEMLFLAKLEQSSASQRIMAVSYVKDLQKADTKTTTALIHTMNTDDNINVRMAAIHGLAKFHDQPEVRQALVESLKTQDDALIQVTLINILVEIQEKAAIDVMKELMQKDKTIDAVKQMAEKGLTTFI